MKRVYSVTSEQEKIALAQRIASAPFKGPFEVVANFKDDRTLDQNDLIHPLCREVAKHMMANGAPKWSEKKWRYYFVAKWKGQELEEDPDGSGGIIVFNVGDGTSGLSKAEASEFIEWLYAFGVDIGVEFDG